MLTKPQQMQTCFKTLKLHIYVHVFILKRRPSSIIPSLINPLHQSSTKKPSNHAATPIAAPVAHRRRPIPLLPLEAKVRFTSTPISPIPAASAWPVSRPTA